MGRLKCGSDRPHTAGNPRDLLHDVERVSDAWMSIDPETRGVVHNEYIRKVERVSGQLYNVELAAHKSRLRRFDNMCPVFPTKSEITPWQSSE
jgi:hypothetical protein